MAVTAVTGVTGVTAVTVQRGYDACAASMVSKLGGRTLLRGCLIAWRL